MAETKADYAHIRGFCYPLGYHVPEEQMKKEMGYALRLRLNSTRIWLNPADYKKDRDKFLSDLLRFVRDAYSFRITTMPILFNGNDLDPHLLDPASWEAADGYIRDVVALLRDEPGLFMWDVMNEPSCNDYIKKAQKSERKQRWERITSFLQHACSVVKEADAHTPVTIGHTYPSDAADTLMCVDVMSFHDYLSTEKQIETSYREAERLSAASGKPFLNSELCCLARANPYDLALRKCEEHHAGWYFFELMIGGYWGDAHGVFYPDGTVRDPSIPAAILGFYRNRSQTAVPASANKEGYARQGIKMVRDALAENTEVFRASQKSIDEVLEAAEFCANLLEACELVPMHDPPTAQIRRIRRSGDVRAARQLAYDLAEILKKECLLL